MPPSESMEEMNARLWAEHVARQEARGYAPHPTPTTAIVTGGITYPTPAREPLSVVPSDEPVFVLRAKDILSVLAIQHYISLLESYNPHTDKVEHATERLNEFRTWQQTHPGKVKLPD